MRSTKNKIKKIKKTKTLLEMTDEEIARQLTLIDFQVSFSCQITYLFVHSVNFHSTYTQIVSFICTVALIYNTDLPQIDVLEHSSTGAAARCLEQRQTKAPVMCCLSCLCAWTLS